MIRCISYAINQLLRCCVIFFVSLHVNANPNTFEVGVENIPTQNAASGYITVNFDTPFITQPLVFVLASTRGGNPCDGRVTNVTLTSFDVACVESSNDGPHAGMDIQYLAVTPGVHTIPTSSGGSVIFEAGSIDTQTQQYNYTCPPGDAATDCVAEGFDVVTPTTAFGTTPAILGQVQTDNSESANPPATNSEPFLTTAFRISEAVPNQFGLALERNEDIDGAVTEDETIAWLAVEDTGGCETLDFSAKGGPAAVNFQSIVTDDQDASSATDTDGFNAIDGWSDGCGANEGASFEDMCFTTTPVVLANKRSRNEEDGGWVRQCTINTGEVRLTIDEDQDTDGERNHADESASVIAFGAAFSTPVTMSQISIDANQTHATFKWQTATETFNIGFNFWGEYQGKWVKLNSRLIPSLARDKLTPSNYNKAIRFRAKHRGQLSKFGISSIDVNGKEEFYGPFMSGESYGEQAIAEPIDWHDIRDKYTQRMKDRGFVFSQGRWIRKSTNSDQTVANIFVSGTDIYSVSYDDIAAAGIDFGSVNVNELAITYKGQPVARRVVSDDEIFNAGDSIQFVSAVPALAKQSSGVGDDLYLSERVFQLQHDSKLALAMSAVDSQIDIENTIFTTQYLKPLKQEANNFYTELSKTDPWLDAEVFSYGSAAEKSYSFVLPSNLNENAQGVLKLDLSGGIDYPGSSSTEPDHHLVVYLNQTPVFDGVADGFNHWQIEVPIAADQLLSGTNNIRLVLPGDTGYQVDIVNVNFVELSYQTNLELDDNNALHFAAISQADAYQITGANLQTKAFAFDDAGNVAYYSQQQSSFQLVDGVLHIAALALQDQIDGLNYWVGADSDMATPISIQAVATKNILPKPDTDYLLIAHPSFIGEDLTGYLNYKNESGYSAEIIDHGDIVEQYGFGMNSPDAVRNYLLAARKVAGIKHVLLIGGHSYDYLDYQGAGALSFIPTYYRPLDVIQYAPTDTPFSELTNDGRPDVALGRWPVRTLADLNQVITKSKEWELNNMNQDRSVLLIAEQVEGGFDYAKSLERTTATTIGKWQDLTKVYMDDVFALSTGNTIADARESITSRINQGVGVTAFNGHGSPSSWTFQSLMSWQHVAGLENYGKPTMVMPLACYTTYYEAPSTNSLAHQWLFSSNGEATQGAVAIHGAMVLGDYRENTLFAEKVLKRQINRGETIGEAILRVKRSLKPWNQMVNNWALLGDPTLRLAR